MAQVKIKGLETLQANMIGILLENGELQDFLNKKISNGYNNVPVFSDFAQVDFEAAYKTVEVEFTEDED